MTTHHIIIAAVGFLAFFVKGIMGTGTTTILVASLALVAGSKEAVVMASLINIVGGIGMLKLDSIPFPTCFLVPILTMMALGSLLGALLLYSISAVYFSWIMAVALLLASVWLWQYKPNFNSEENLARISSYATTGDRLVALIAGICGGLVGVNAPILILYFGNFMKKRLLRRFLVVIFIPAAIVQSTTFYMLGFITPQIAFNTCLMFPGLVLGLYTGNLAFQKISELHFRRGLALIVFLISIKMLS